VFRPLLLGLAAMDCLTFRSLLALETLGAVSVRVAISLTVLEILLVVPSLEAKIAFCAVLSLDLVCNTVKVVGSAVPSLSAFSGFSPLNVALLSSMSNTVDEELASHLLGASSALSNCAVSS